MDRQEEWAAILDAARRLVALKYSWRWFAGCPILGMGEGRFEHPSYVTRDLTVDQEKALTADGALPNPTAHIVIGMLLHHIRGGNLYNEEIATAFDEWMRMKPARVGWEVCGRLVTAMLVALEADDAQQRARWG